MPYITTEAYGVPRLLAGESVGLEATADKYPHQKLNPEWSTSDPARARIEHRDGKATLCGVAPGPVTLIARFDDGAVQEKPFTVLDPAHPKWVAFELAQEGHAPGRFRFRAEAMFEADYKRDVTAHPLLSWESSDPAVAAWEAPGLLAAHRDGDVTVGVRGMGVEKSLPLNVAGGIGARLDSVLHFNPAVPLGAVLPLDCLVQRTDEKLYQRTAAGLRLAVSRPEVLALDLTAGRETMRALALGTTEVVAELGRQRLVARCEVVDRPVTLAPIRIEGDGSLAVGPGETRLFVDAEAALSTELRWEKGTLIEALNLEWTSTAPQVLAVVKGQYGVSIRGVAPGEASVVAHCPRLGLRQERPVRVVEPPEINWF